MTSEDQRAAVRLPGRPPVVTSGPALTAFIAAFEDMARALWKAYAPAIRALGDVAHAIDFATRPRWHRRFCARCRSRRASRPLCINGHDYHRRQRNRRKRRRRG